MEPSYERKYLQIEDKNWWFVARRGLMGRVTHNLVNRDSRVLDLGCGSGKNMQLFHPDNVYGLDISRTSVKEAHRLGNRNLAVGDAVKTPFKDNSFDFIFCLDLLEHIEDDENLIHELEKILKDDGFLIIFVPCFNFLWGIHDVINKHYRRYSKKDLDRLTRNTELAVKDAFYWNFSLFLPSLLYKLIKRARTREGEAMVDDFVSMPAAVNSLLLHILKFENFLITRGFRPPVGTSLVAVLGKEGK